MAIILQSKYSSDTMNLGLTVQYTVGHYRPSSIRVVGESVLVPVCQVSQKSFSEILE